MNKITVTRFLIALLLMTSIYFAISIFNLRSDTIDLRSDIIDLEAENVDLKLEVVNLRVDIITNDIGGEHYLAPLPNYPQTLYMSSKEPITGTGVWFIVGPNGIPGAEGSHLNFGGFEVWRLDPSLPESATNCEWLEIGSGSPCWSTDDFLIASARFGEGKCRDIIFGSMRTDTDAHQRAFIIRSTYGRDIYTSFTEDIEVLKALITTDSSSLGLFGNEPVGQQPHIDDADGTLEDLTFKLNELLNTLEAYGLLK